MTTKLHQRLLETSPGYADWHKHEYHSHYHWALFLFASFALMWMSVTLARFDVEQSFAQVAEYSDNFDTNPYSGRWANEIKNGVWDSANLELDIADDNDVVIRYTSSPGSIDQEAQVTARANTSTRLVGPGVRWDNAGVDTGYGMTIENGGVLIYRWTNGVRSPVQSFAMPVTYTGGNFYTMRLAASGGVGGNVTFHIWVVDHGATKPTDPGWIGNDSSPQITFTDSTTSRISGATNDHGAIAGRASVSIFDDQHDYFKLRAISARGGTAPPPPPPPTSSDTTPPSVSITSHTNDATVSGTITITATASDNVAVAGVIFSVGPTIIGAEDTTTPYSVFWNTAGVADGQYLLSATARDTSSNSTNSSYVRVNVSNAAPPPPPSDITPPTVAITAPTVGSTVSGSSVTVSANASDNIGVSGVQFRLDGTNLGAEDTSAPYSISWNTTGATNGTHTLTAVARDAAGNTATSPLTSVTVSNVTTPPPTPTLGANYPLEIIQPQPNLTTVSRYYKAYPGLLYRVPIGVFGGAYPFTYSLTSAPSGMTIDQNGIINWPNPTTSGSPHPVTVRVTDAAGTSVTRSWTITVTTAGFLFIDAVNGTHALGFGCTANCGTGTLTNPFRSLLDVYRGTDYASMSDATYNDYFMYFRGGTHGLEGFFNGADVLGWSIEWRGQVKPHVWLAYPGETVVIDHNLAPGSIYPGAPAGSPGAYIDWRDGNSDDAFIHGITFRDMGNHTKRMNGDRIVLFENTFFNMGPGMDGANSSFIMFSGNMPLTEYYALVKNNLFDTLNTGAFIKTYGTYYSVFEGNTFRNGSGNPLEGLAIKAGDQYVDVRGNTFDGDFRDGSINGNWNGGNNLEIRYNNIKNAPAGSNAIWMNHDGMTNAPVYIYRNTFEGTARITNVSSSNGPFNIYNNVIVNDDSGTPAGSHVTQYNVSDQSRIVLTNNLVGSPSQNIIDANGNLTSAYSSYLGTHGHQVVGGSTTSPPPPPPPPSDTTVPTVSITSPTSGSTVSSSAVTVSANASDNVGVSGVQFRLDGANLGAEDTSAPYSITWNTTTATNGTHTLTAVARDAAGNSATSPGVTVTVSNTTIPPSSGLIIFDDFEYPVGKFDSASAKTSAFTSAGWSGLKDETTRPGGASGYLSTVTSIPGYTGSFPSGGSRVLLMEGLPTTMGDFSGAAGTWRNQTDFYLQLGNGGSAAFDDYIPGDVWIQFWAYPQYYGSQLSSFSARNKFLYACNGSYGCHTHLWMIHSASRADRPLMDPWPFGNPSQGDVLFGVTESAGLSNIEYTGPNYDPYSNSNIGQQTLSEWPRENRWTLVKMHLNTTRTSGNSWEMWLRPMGGAWTKVAEWIGGVTPGFIWDIPSGSEGGHRELRMPSTWGTANFSDNTNYDAWLYLDDFAIATSESALPTYGTTPLPPPPTQVVPPTRFTSGSRVQTNATVNVRSTAAGTSLGTQPVAALATVTGGPTYASLSGTNFWWWNLNFDTSIDGWVADDFLNPYTAPPPPPPPSDVTPPTISITAPTAGSTVSGSSVTVSANASDNVGVSGVQFRLDGTNLGAEDTSAPYSITWNTTGATNGTHTLTAVARDATGNTATSPLTSVTVSNVTTPPPTPTLGANYPLELINIKPIGTVPTGLSAGNRIYRAYPGLEYNIRAAVMGGVYPFTYSLSNAPSGMTINTNTGEISWPNPQANASPTITVRDAAGTQVSATWPITVSTSGFQFVDAVNGRSVAEGGTGTRANPWRTLADMRSNGAPGAITYLRAGTYTPAGMPTTSASSETRVEFDERYQSVIWLGYPGDARPVIDYGHTPGSDTTPRFRMTGRTIYLDGLETTRSRIMAFQMVLYQGGEGFTARRNYMHNGGPGIDGSNAAYIMVVRTTAAFSVGTAIQDNRFYDTDGVTIIKTYDMDRLLVEDNLIHGNIDTPISPDGGLAIKGFHGRWEIRGNRSYDFDYTSAAGNQDGAQNGEIRFNNFYNSDNYNHVISINQNSSAGPIYIYRNTFRGGLWIRNTDAPDGPFTFYNNVVVNNHGSRTPAYFYFDNVTDPSRVVSTNNLFGAPSQNIVDSNGNLTTAYSSYLGTHGHQLVGGATPTPPPPPPPGDTTVPTVSITSPTSGSTVSSSAVTVSANASDNVGISGVQFRLDGANLGAEDTSAPYSITWNTTTVTNGTHTLTAVARDAAGNTTTSSNVSVTVSNTTTAPPTTGAPVVSNFSINLRQGEARFRWNTDRPATSQVEYGVTTAYGTQSAISTLLRTSHEVIVPGFSAGSYNARAVSTASSLTGLSNNLSFTVRSRPPRLNTVTATPGSIILNWSPISFTGYSGVAILRSTTGYFNQYDANFEIARVTGTGFTDQSVTPGITYYYSLFVYDDQENYSDPATVSFVAPASTNLPTPIPTPQDPPVSSGGGGGGGGTMAAPALGGSILPSNFNSLPKEQQISVLTAMIAELRKLIDTLIAQGAGLPSGACAFTRDLTLGSTGEDVRCLQKHLNSSGFPVSSSGLGSTGNESTYFGPATRSALIRWQNAKAIMPASGYFGPKSRAAYSAGSN